MNNAIGTGFGFGANVLPSGPFLPGSAKNGLSVEAGAIVLGDLLGFTGPADFLNDRAIDMQGFTFSQIHRNQAGFDDWKFEQQDNFMFMQDINNTFKTIYWTVDYAGNTGQFIGNNRAEPGWIPPFILLADTGTGTFGRLQFSAQDAIEITDSVPNFALAHFPSGNVAIQNAGGPDQGYKFYIDSNHSNIASFNWLGNTYFLVNPNFGVAQLGDITGTLTYFSADIGFAPAIRAFVSGGSVLNLDPTNTLYAFGDLSNLGNGMSFFLDDTGGKGDLTNAALTAAYSINGNAGASGTFTTADAKTVTVIGGIITAIV